MKRQSIRVLVIFAVVSVLGIIVVQTYWFRQAFNAESERFHREVNTALFNVAGKLFALKGTTEPNSNPIKQLSSNYYVVMINDEINAGLLETLLREEFRKRDIMVDFEYGIYDCNNEQMVYGDFITMGNTRNKNVQAGILPVWKDQPYYFGVHFPGRLSVIANRMDMWIFTSGVLAIVILFFGYALFVILKQRRLSEVQKDFINNMTHEFKTPLSTIKLSSEVLKDHEIGKSPERLHKYASIIEHESLLLRDQVTRMLQMAQTDNEDLELSLEDTHLNDLIIKTMENAWLKLSEKNGWVCLDLCEESTLIRADHLHVANVLNNILDNAIKYCRNAPRIHIRTICFPNLVMVEIEDNGIGIPARHLKKVFQKFYRVPTGNVHDVKGFGLGLNYVRLIMDKHKGRVSLTSQPGSGSQITLKFNHA